MLVSSSMNSLRCTKYYYHQWKLICRYIGLDSLKTIHVYAVNKHIHDQRIWYTLSFILNIQSLSRHYYMTPKKLCCRICMLCFAAPGSQGCYFSQNIAFITPKIIHFCYQKWCWQDQSIVKKVFAFWKTFTAGRQWCCLSGKGEYHPEHNVVSL